MITFVFKAFEAEDYETGLMNKLAIAFAMYVCVGFAIMVTQFGSVRYFITINLQKYVEYLSKSAPTFYVCKDKDLPNSTKY